MAAGSIESKGVRIAEAPVARDVAPQTDLALVRAVLAGDESARRSLAVRLVYVARILAARNRRLGHPFSPSELEDLLQDALAKTWESLPHYRGESALESWVYPVCVRTLANALRERRARRRWLPTSSEVDLDRLTAEQAAVAGDVELVALSLDRIEPERAQAIRLRHENEASFAEIGERLGVPEGTARTWYHRGLSRLRELMGAEQPGGGE